MYCVANICYVCLEKKSKLISNINESSVNKDIIHIIHNLPFNLAWLKTKRNLLVCEQCCSRLRETYQFLEICLKNNTLLEGYMDKLKTTPLSITDNEAQLLVHLNIKHKAVDEVKRETQLEDEEIYPIQWQPNIERTEDCLVKEEIICKNEVDDKQEYPTDNQSTEIIEETEDVFVDFEDSFVKKDNALKMRNGNDPEEYAMGNNSTENIDNESDSKISVNDNVPISNSDGVALEFTCKQPHSSKADLNTTVTKPYNCSTCNKSFITKSGLKRHKRIHTGEYKCTECNKCFGSLSDFVQHERVHTGEKLFVCATCKKCFSKHFNLKCHMRTHTVEKPYKCSKCTKSFTFSSNLIYHMRIHTGEKPYKCSKCDACFRSKSHLNRHQRVHSE